MSPNHLDLAKSSVSLFDYSSRELECRTQITVLPGIAACPFPRRRRIRISHGTLIG